MSSKRNQRRRSCTGKRRHETIAEARAEAQRLLRRMHWPMQAYHCQACGGYHVGHMPKRHIRAMRQAQEARG